METLRDAAAIGVILLAPILQVDYPLLRLALPSTDWPTTAWGNSDTSGAAETRQNGIRPFPSVDIIALLPLSA